MQFIMPVEITPGSASAWIDADVSAYVPSGAMGVILHLVNNTIAKGVGFRKNGSTDNRTQSLGATSHFWSAVGVDANRILELYAEDITNIDVYLVGYYTNDAVFFTNAVNKSLTTTGAWTDINISSDTGADTAIGAIFEVKDSGSSSDYYGLRKNGSTDDRRAKAANGHSAAVVGVDGSEICEGYIANVTVDFYLVGYIVSGSTFYTNATDVSLATTAAWTNLMSLPSGAIGAYIEVYPSDYYYGLRKDGSAEDIYFYGRHPWGVVEASSLIIEGKIANVAVDFWLVGYPTAAGTTYYQSLPAAEMAICFLAKTPTWGKLLSIMEISAAALLKINTFLKILLITEISIASLTKKMFQTLLAIEVSAVSLIKAFFYQISIIIAEISAAGISAVKLKLVAMSAVEISSAALSKIITWLKSISTTEISAVAISKIYTFFKNLSVTENSIAVLSKTATFFRTLAAQGISATAMISAKTFHKILSVIGNFIAFLLAGTQTIVSMGNFILRSIYLASYTVKNYLKENILNDTPKNSKLNKK